MVTEKKTVGVVFVDVGRASDLIVPLSIRLSRIKLCLERTSPEHCSSVLRLEDLFTGRVSLTLKDSKRNGGIRCMTPVIRAALVYVARLARAAASHSGANR